LDRINQALRHRKLVCFEELRKCLYIDLPGHLTGIARFWKIKIFKCTLASSGQWRNICCIWFFTCFTVYS